MDHDRLIVTCNWELEMEDYRFFYISFIPFVHPCIEFLKKNETRKNTRFEYKAGGKRHET